MTWVPEKGSRIRRVWIWTGPGTEVGVSGNKWSTRAIGTAGSRCKRIVSRRWFFWSKVRENTSMNDEWYRSKYNNYLGNSRTGNQVHLAFRVSHLSHDGRGETGLVWVASLLFWEIGKSDVVQPSCSIVSFSFLWTVGSGTKPVVVHFVVVQPWNWWNGHGGSFGMMMMDLIPRLVWREWRWEERKEGWWWLEEEFMWIDVCVCRVAVRRFKK